MEDGWNAPWLQLAVTISKVAFDSCSIYFSEEKEDEMTEEGRVVEPYEEVQGCVTEGGRDNVCLSNSCHVEVEVVMVG